MTCPYPGLASGSDWLKQILTNQKHRSWKVTHHQYRISVLVPKTVVAICEYRLFSLAILIDVRGREFLQF